jgi:hypothetical protein
MKYRNKQESFENLLDTGTETNDCYAKSINECVNYSNCGIATIEGRQQCIPGDIEGPQFETNVYFDQWSYKDQYDGHIFNEVDDTQNYNTWSTFYPSMYEIFYPSPVTRSALF